MLSRSGILEGRMTGPRQRCTSIGCPGWFVAVTWESGQALKACSQGWHYDAKTKVTRITGGGEISGRVVSPPPLGVDPLPKEEWPDPGRPRQAQGLAHRRLEHAPEPAVGQTAGVTDGHAGPAQLDPGAYFGDWGAELQRCARQHWWAQAMDPTGAPMAVVLAWEANRATLTDRRLSPRSFPDDMVANGLSPATAVQVAPLFSRHGDDHRHLRAVLSTAFTPEEGGAAATGRPRHRRAPRRRHRRVGRRLRVRRRLRRAAAARGVRDPVRPPGRGPRSDGALGGGHRPRLQPVDAAGARGAGRGGGRRDARLRPRADRRQPRRARATTSSPGWSRPRSTATACPTTTSSP